MGEPQECPEGCEGRGWLVRTVSASHLPRLRLRHVLLRGVPRNLRTMRHRLARLRFWAFRHRWYRLGHWLYGLGQH